MTRSTDERLGSLILVGGNGGGGFRFDLAREVVARKGSRFSWFTPTLPGFDGRPLQLGARGLGPWSQSLLDVIRAAPAPRVVYGHGVGGSFVLDALSRAGSRHLARAVVLHAPVGARLRERRFPKLMKPMIIRSTARRMIASPQLRRIWKGRFFQGGLTEEQIDRFFNGYRDCDAFEPLFERIDADWFESLPPIDLPAALLWGGAERLLSPDQARAYLRVLPRASLHTIAGWTHFPMLDDPERFVDELEWIASDLVREGRAGPTEVPRLGEQGLPWGAGSKAAQLDEAMRDGFRVPEGSVVLDEVDPTQLASFSTDAKSTFAVRSSFDLEDGGEQSGAGGFLSELGVPGSESALIDAVERVRKSGERTDPAPSRRDVLIQRQVEAKTAGVAFVEPRYEDDLVEWADGLGESVVRGAGTQIQLPQLRSFERRSGPRAEDGWQRRLQELLRDLRETYAGRAEFERGFDIEWADDGEVCWLLQLRPVTAAVERGSLFTVANHKEILPELPSVLMTSVLEQNAAALYGYYRTIDPTLPEGRPFLRVFHGRPRIDLGLLVDTVRHWGLPSRLVTEAIGGGAEVDHRFRLGRFLRKLPRLSRLGWSQLRAPARAKRLQKELAAAGGHTARSFAEITDEIGQVYVRLVHGMMDLTGSMAGPLGVLRKLGWLEKLATGHRSVTTDLFVGVEELRDSLSDDAALREKLAEGEWPDGHEDEPKLRAFLDEHGHRALYESDLERPRFREEPAPLLRALAVRGGGSRVERGRAPLWMRVLGGPLWCAVRGPLAAREALRDGAMKGFAELRSELLRAGERAVERGALPEAKAVFDLEVPELVALDDGDRWDAERLAERRERTERLRSVRLPDLFHSKDPLASREEPIPDGALMGLGLVAGRVEGTVVRLDDPAQPLPIGAPRPLVLVAPAVDAGWIPLMTQADAVLVETGGELSHGSIVLREVGVVSVTNLRGASQLESGDSVRVDGAGGVVERV